jgi:hypothetical protein
LDGDWKPSAGDHKETIYYIAGYVLRGVNKKGTDSRELLSDAFQVLESNASTSKASATAASLPLGRVERAEVSKVYYTNRPFYELMCLVESVFDQLLSEENVYLFGVFIIDNISHYLSKVDIDLGQRFNVSFTKSTFYTMCKSLRGQKNLFGGL